ncbi:hypothetical protein GCM10010448_65010 [Streptomyces glomeratus]|uniref:Uncharacterized protein n=1 Tax=Streptomyces glomeratus TaxID=284452 RepID=A0ABP6M2C1_9ACTN
MPQFPFHLAAPWWAWLLITILALLAKTLIRITKAVFPTDSQHRLEWWKAYFGRREEQ